MNGSEYELLSPEHPGPGTAATGALAEVRHSLSLLI